MNLSLSKIKRLLLKKTIVFILTLVALNYLIIKIPFERLFFDSLPFELSKNISRIIHGLILIVFSILTIKKFSLNRFAGIRLFNIKRPYLLLLPIVYPMSLGIHNLFQLKADHENWVLISVTFIAMVSKGLAEEVTFRGLLQSYLIKKYSTKLSVLQIVCISSIIFSLMHIINITRYEYVDVINQVIGAFFFGVFFGALIIKTGNVFALGFLHGCINFIFKAGSLGLKTGLTNEKYLYSVSEILSTIAIYTLVFLPLLVIGVLLLKKSTNKPALT